METEAINTPKPIFSVSYNSKGLTTPRKRRVRRKKDFLPLVIKDKTQVYSKHARISDLSHSKVFSQVLGGINIYSQGEYEIGQLNFHKELTKRWRRIIAFKEKQYLNRKSEPKNDFWLSIVMSPENHHLTDSNSGSNTDLLFN